MHGSTLCKKKLSKAKMFKKSIRSLQQNAVSNIIKDVSNNQTEKIQFRTSSGKDMIII
jgi:hypothetical protein